MNSLTLNANPKQCLTKQQGDEKWHKKEKVEKRRNAQAYQKAAENRRKKYRWVVKEKKGDACNRSAAENKNYGILEHK